MDPYRHCEWSEDWSSARRERIRLMTARAARGQPLCGGAMNETTENGKDETKAKRRRRRRRGRQPGPKPRTAAGANHGGGITVEELRDVMKLAKRVGGAGRLAKLAKALA